MADSADKDIKTTILKNLRDFPDGTAVKTPRFQSRGCRFDPWSVRELKSHMLRDAVKLKEKEKNLGQKSRK